jgi:hypothetical protein
MKQLAATDVLAEATQWCTRSYAAEVEASHGQTWHRRTKGGKPDVRFVESGEIIERRIRTERFGAYTRRRFYDDGAFDLDPGDPR